MTQPDKDADHDKPAPDDRKEIKLPIVRARPDDENSDLELDLDEYEEDRRYGREDIADK